MRAIATFSGCDVEQIRIDFATELVLRLADGTTAHLRLESEPGRSDFPVERPWPLASLSNVALRIFNSGRLRIELGDGRLLEVDADQDYEAWTLTLSTGELFVCQPGGGVSHFD